MPTQAGLRNRVRLAAAAKLNGHKESYSYDNEASIVKFVLAVNVNSEIDVLLTFAQIAVPASQQKVIE